MIKLFKDKSINKVNFLSIVFASILLVGFITLIIYNSYQQYKDDIKQLESDYIKSQKKFIEQETQRVLKYIIYKHKKYKDKPLKQLQDEIVDVIEQMRNERDGTGYIFIYTFEGINIADPILKYNAGKNLLNFKDMNGKKVIYELIEVSKLPNGGYVNYVWNKPTTNTPAPKISYAMSYTPWKWMIGSGVYLDNIENVIQEKKDEYYKKISKYLAQIFLFLIILFLIGIVVYKYLMDIIQKDIELIRMSSENLKNIDIQSLSFSEFKKVAFHINIMNENLQDLNKNLENKVNIRTKELKESEQYAIKLVEQQDRFVKDAIHEINTPLSIIIANIDLFKMKFETNRYLSKIEAGSKIIHNIYNDLEYMVKKDRIKYTKEDINFSEFVKDRLGFFNEIAIGNELKFVSYIEENIDVYFNTTLLQRILDNTLSNAIKYSYKNSDIEVKLYKKDDKIYLEIINTGDTIKDTVKLFDRFYRENNSRGGFGIGLNIIKEVCTKNGVVMEVSSVDNLTVFRYVFENKKEGGDD